MNLWTDIAIGNLLRERPPPIEEETKMCNRCRMTKPLSSFYLRITDNRPDHYSANCRVCQRAAEKARRNQQRNET